MRKSVLLALAAALAGSPASLAQSVPAQDGKHVLKLDDVELNTLVADISTLTGYTFIVHPDVRRTRVSVVSQTPLSPSEIFQVFLTTLRVHGFVAVPAGRDTYRIVPENIATTEAPLAAQGAGGFVTEIFRLNHTNALEAAQMIKPILDTQGQVVANAGANALVVVDYSSNLSRARKIIEAIDRDPSTVETVSLRNVPASEMEALLNKLNQGSGDQPGFGRRFSAIASGTSNAIVLRGSESEVRRARQVAEQLDASDPERDNIRVITLSNADAAELVPILERLGASLAAQRAPSEAQSPVQTIAHHPPTNSLIISANQETLLAMEKVVASLDVRRPQVMVEAIIVEMSDEATRELGLQFLVSSTGSGDVPFASTNFSRSAPNLLALTGAVVTDAFDNLTRPNPFRDAAIRSLVGTPGLVAGIGGQSGDTLFGAIINAVENDTDSRILSTPFGMTLNNATSKLIVGQEIPITTGEVLGDANANPFRTVQRQDVGVQLEVTPRIGENNTVQLDIRQEVSNVFGSVGTVTQDLILDKREIKASVLADNGEIIVLGGLVEQRDTRRDARVPILGRIPLLGRLFSSRGNETTRTNLMVFIRPTIVRNQNDAGALTAQRFMYVRGEELMRGIGSDESIDAFLNEVIGRPGPQGLGVPSE